MGNRKRTGWHRIINGVNISGFFVVLFIVLPLYWLVITSFRDPADLGSVRSSGRTRGAALTTRRPSCSTTSARTSSTRWS